MNRYPLSTSPIMYVVVIILIATAYFLYALWTPLLQDDLVFQAQSLDPADPAAGFTPAGWWHHTVINWIEDNSRLANLIAPVGSMLFPQWLRAIIIAVTVATLFMLAESLTRDSSHHNSPASNAAALASIWFISLLAWPWRDRMMMWVYSLNYVTAMTLILLFVCMLLRYPTSHGGNRTSHIAVTITGLCVAIAAGWFHNGLSAPLLAATGCWTLWKRFKLTPRQWLWCGGLFAGTLLAHLSPAIWTRAQQEASQQHFVTNLVATIKIMPLAWLLTGTLAAYVMLPKLRLTLKQLLNDNIFFVTTIGAIVATAMNLLLEIAPRYGWGGEIMATIAIWRWARLKMPSAKPATSITLCIVLTGLTLVPMQAIIRTQHLLWEEHCEITAAIATSPRGTIFRDIIGRDDTPALALRQTTAGIWGNAFHMACYNSHHMEGDHMGAVVPSALSDFDFSKGERLAGDAGIYRYKGLMVSADTIAPFPTVQGFPSGRQRSAIRILKINDPSGNRARLATDVFKFNLPTGNHHTAVYWSELPPPFDTVPGVRVSIVR